MNYIKQLQEHITELELSHKRKNEAINDLFYYLSLPKFHKDTTVQVADIKQRLLDIRLLNGWEN